MGRAVYPPNTTLPIRMASPGAQRYTARFAHDHRFRMLELCKAPFDLGPECSLIACRFEKSAQAENLSKQLAIALPEKLNKAVAKRKIEYLSGRYCAREALRAIDGPHHQTIANREDRSPIWPEGFVGSITHSNDYAAAMVARTDHFRGVGVDVEQLISEKTAHNVSRQILLPSETFADNRQMVASDRHYLTLIFSAKESIFKALYPMVNTFFGFSAAQITLDSQQPHQFHFTLMQTLNDEFCEGYSASGQWFADNDYLYTAVALRT